METTLPEISAHSTTISCRLELTGARYVREFGMTLSRLEESYDEINVLNRGGLQWRLALKIGRISIASPGIVDVIGDLNPLKVIADFITHYRAENTKRMAIGANSLVKREEIRSSFAYHVFGLMPEASRTQDSDRLFEVARTVIDPTFLKLEALALDQSLKQVYLLDNDKGGSE